MTRRLPLLFLLFLPVCLAAAPGAVRIAAVNFRQAVTTSRKGHELIEAARSSFAPREAGLKRDEDELAGLRSKLAEGQNLLSEPARQDLEAEIARKEKQLQRDAADLQTDIQQEETRIFKDVGREILAVLPQVAGKLGYSVVLDFSAPSSEIAYSAKAVDITQQVISAYDSASSGGKSE